MFRTALASVQKSAAQTPPSKDARPKLSNPGDQKGSLYSRHNEFSEVIFITKLETWGICLKDLE